MPLLSQPLCPYSYSSDVDAEVDKPTRSWSTLDDGVFELVAKRVKWLGCIGVKGHRGFQPPHHGK